MPSDSMPSAAEVMVHVPSLAALKRYDGPASFLHRDGFRRPDDGGAAFYVHSPGACSNADDGAQVPSAMGGCWIGDLGKRVDAKVWGLKEDGSSPDGALLNTAIKTMARLGGGTIVIDGPTRAETSIIDTRSVYLTSDNYDPSWPEATSNGGRIICDAAVGGTNNSQGYPACVTVTPIGGNSGATSGAGLARLAVGFAGTPAAGSIAVQYLAIYDARANDVLAYNASIGFDIKAAGPYGITLYGHGWRTRRISDAHVVQDGWPELRISDARFGSNGPEDVACNDFVRVTGGGTGTSPFGPNTLAIQDTQFNLGAGGLCTNLINFADLNSAGTGGIISEFSISDSHSESAKHIVAADRTVTHLARVRLTNNTFLDNATNSPDNHDFWNLMPGVILDNFITAANLMLVQKFTLTAANQVSQYTSSGDQFLLGPVSITGANTYSNVKMDSTFDGLSLAGTFNSAFITGTLINGPFTNTATGSVSASIGGVTSKTGPTTFTNTTATDALRVYDDGDGHIEQSSKGGPGTLWLCGDRACKLAIGAAGGPVTLGKSGSVLDLAGTPTVRGARGVSCSGPPTPRYTVTDGIVTHC